MPTPLLANLFGDWWMLLILGFVGLLIFGKRLPEVGKNMGKGIVEFKKGLSGIEDDLTRNPQETAPPRVEGSASRQISNEHSGPASASTSDPEIAAMREEMRRLREELNATKAKLYDQHVK